MTKVCPLACLALALWMVVAVRPAAAAADAPTTARVASDSVATQEPAPAVRPARPRATAPT